MAGSSLIASNHSRQVFTVGPSSYAVRDVLDAAQFRGEVQPVWEEFLRLVACDERAANEDREADDAAIDTAVQTFRYDHDLITAEETERWLAERDLTLSDFSDYFTRHYWGEAMGDGLKGEEIDYFSAAAELRDVFMAELVFSGEFVRMATRFAWRLTAAVDGKTAPSEEEIEAQLQLLIARLKPGALPSWTAQMGRDADWINQMSHLEAAFRMVNDSVLSPQARKREVGTLRLQLTTFDLEVLEVDSQDAAREALLCVREDDMKMEEVATEGRYPFHREQLVLDDITPELQQQFLSATPGLVLEPMEVDGAHRLCQVVAKHEPDPEDPAVQRRVEKRLLDRHFDEAMTQHVQWNLSPS